MVTPTQLEYKEKEMRKDKMKQIEKLVEDLQWEHQRMSRSGQETLDKLVDLVLPKKSTEEMKKELLAMGCPEESLHLYLGKE